METVDTNDRMLTWHELRQLPVGTLLIFNERYDIYPYGIAELGTLAIMFNASEYGIIDVLPADVVLCDALREWKGCVSFSPENDGYSWDDLSPLKRPKVTRVRADV